MANKPGSDWGAVVRVPRLKPMGGCRPLDTYGAKIPGDAIDFYRSQKDERHRKEYIANRPCPCQGMIPRGSALVCLVCCGSGYDAPLIAERHRDKDRETAAFERHMAQLEAERGKTLSDRKAKQAAEREARRRARRQTSAEVAA